MRLYMPAPSMMTMSDPELPPEDLSPRRRRLQFRAWHRGTKETDLMVGAFVARHIATFTEAELDDLEQVLELLDVDLQDWLSGRRPIPAEVASPMLARMAAECAGRAAGTTPEIRAGLGLDPA
ncbi:antitoxin CptB [Falsiroseomonas stagni DSM 19981]|uniref:FAD assembly factor SdhE n=2 Tax=Falsiroseomonas TaxID=2870713 RepID=A0A1I4AY31_9PROT|nr:antitoxin CptB [Falsiroseomonas stagni DSM 19981]